MHGVTKNVAKMWDEYAKKIGTTSNNLTQHQKIQAEVSGILEETKFQTGDATRYLDTYSGQLSMLNASLLSLKQTVGSAIIPVLQAILPYINTVIQALLKLAQVFAGVLQLIFRKSAKAVDETAKTTKNLADNTNAAAGGMGNLGKATKKAKKEVDGALASFDQLNVLVDSSNNDIGAGGGSNVGGAGGGLDLDFGGADVDGAIEVSQELLDIFEKLKEACEPTRVSLKRLWEALQPLKEFSITALKDFYEIVLKPIGKWVLGEGLPRFIDAISNGLEKINWGNINESLRNLFSAITPFAINIGEGLLWFWENVLMPLRTWTINNALPVFLDLLAGAIKILTSIMKGGRSSNEWFLKNFLEPLAKWTGKIIISALGTLAKILNAIGDWMSKNQKVVNGMSIVVGLFFLAWKTTEVMAFIQMSGGLISTLKKVGTAISGLTAKKLIDKAETMYLTALYAKDFAISLAKTVVELGKQAVALVASTALKIANNTAVGGGTALALASAIAVQAVTAAQWLWNAAMAANPIRSYYCSSSSTYRRPYSSNSLYKQRKQRRP